MQIWKEGNLYSGFYLKKIEELSDIDATGYLLEHIKSGASLYYVQKQDKNKVFFVAFKTLPQDDCGTAHILEHSVLCGSKKYQVKDPFNELAKGSLNTYLNAMTFADKTMYPIASCNEKDFRNLMDVYLDAVFHPFIFDRKEIFMQEGWHYELERLEDPLKINGVVYNEMKGAFSDPERLFSNQISKSLFSHSIYRFESGGYPAAIPNLTYEDFLEFYKKSYHPSNSFLYLYGKMDLAEQLEFLDQNYLSAFEKIEIDSSIAFEPRRKEIVFAESTYPAIEKKENGCFVSYNTVIGKSTDAKLALTFDILSYILLKTNASPIKKALLEAGIGEEIEGWFDSSSLEMVFSIVAKQVKPKDTERFQNVIWTTLREIVKNGLDPHLMESCFPVWEFHLKEEDYGYRPKGLVYGIKLMKSWLHGSDTGSYLHHFKHFYEIKKEAENGYLEQCIQKLLLENSHSSFVVMKPEQGKMEKENKQEQKRLAEQKQKFSHEELIQIQKETKVLKEYQAKEDAPELREQIPLLHLDEIEKEIEFDEVKQIKGKNASILFTPLATNGILYLQLLFDTNHISKEEVPYIGLLAEMMGKLDTRRYDFNQLPLELNQWTGGFSAACHVYHKEDQTYETKMGFHTKILDRNLQHTITLIREMIEGTQYTEYEHLKIILKEAKSKIEQDFTNYAHSTAVQRCLSYFDEGNKWKEWTAGIDFYHFLCELDRNFENKKEEIGECLKIVAQKIFSQGELTIAVSMEEKGAESNLAFLTAFAESIQKEPKKEQRYSLLTGIKREGFYQSSMIQYNVQGADFKKLGYVYSGEMQVLRTILNLEYLWNKIRVQGGAYGSGCGINRDGMLYLYSYRDPHLQKTLDGYKEIGQFLRNFSLTDRELTKYLIGTISGLDQPLTNAKRASRSINRTLCGITKEKLLAERESLLSTKKESLKKYADLFDQVVKEGYLCVIGNEEKIKQEKRLFEQVISLKGAIPYHE